jgi:hypothetical protein
VARYPAVSGMSLIYWFLNCNAEAGSVPPMKVKPYVTDC